MIVFNCIVMFFFCGWLVSLTYKDIRDDEEALAAIELLENLGYCDAKKRVGIARRSFPTGNASDIFNGAVRL